MASHSQPQTQSPPHDHERNHRKLSLRHLDSPIMPPTLTPSDHHEHEGLCPHDHEHTSLMSRHHHSLSHGGDAPDDSNISLPSGSKHAEQAVAPFLAQHIPMQYNPIGHILPPGTTSDDSAASSTKFCYRHRPDLKCRRQANEPSMEQLQNVSAVVSAISRITSMLITHPAGIGHAFSIRSAGHLPRLGPLLCRSL